MASMQELLAAMSNIQPDAQAALPVLPNNGNPAGAYNMPASAGAAAPAVVRPPIAPKDFSWLQSSQYMRNVQDMLNQRRTAGATQQPMQAQQAGQMQAPYAQAGMVQQSTAGQLPAIPARQEREDRPSVLPQRRNEYVP